MDKAVSQLKNYLIPYSANDFRPRALERRAAIFFLAVFIAAEILFLSSAFLAPRTAIFADISTLAIFNLVNKSRSELGFGELSVNKELQKAAEAKAADMAKNGYFSHVSPQGVAPWFWMEKSGYDYYYAGENLARGFIDANSVFDAWMRSRTHRANILNPNYNDIGVAVVSTEISGKKTNIIVQMFGSSSKTVAPLKPAEKTKPTSMEYGRLTAALISNISGIGNNFFTFGSALILLIFFLNLFVNFRIQHRDLILNGLIVIAVALGAIIFNNHLINSGLDILEAANLIS